MSIYSSTNIIKPGRKSRATVVHVIWRVGVGKSGVERERVSRGRGERGAERRAWRVVVQRCVFCKDFQGCGL